MSTLNVYSPLSYHDDGYIVGTAEALADLANAIHGVLDGNGNQSFQAFDSGGEGYELNVILVSEEAVIRLDPPYKDAFHSDDNSAWSQIQN